MGSVSNNRHGFLSFHTKNSSAPVEVRKAISGLVTQLERMNSFRASEVNKQALVTLTECQSKVNAICERKPVLTKADQDTPSKGPSF